MPLILGVCNIFTHALSFQKTTGIMHVLSCILICMCVYSLGVKIPMENSLPASTKSPTIGGAVRSVTSQHQGMYPSCGIWLRLPSTASRGRRVSAVIFIPYVTDRMPELVAAGLGDCLFTAVAAIRRCCWVQFERRGSSSERLLKDTQTEVIWIAQCKLLVLVDFVS